MNPSKLWQLRRSIFGVGAAQVLLSAALLAGLLMLTDFAWQAAVVGGIGLAMSSTAMALQLMREKGMNRSESGQLGFSVSAVSGSGSNPSTGVSAVVGGSADEHFDWMKIGMKVLAFVGMLIGGRYLLRPVFRFIAASGVREVFTAATLLLVLGSALFMDALGLSMALGTFIAGVLLAESEYRHELETAIDPFKRLAARFVLYLCRHVTQPRGALYPSVVGSDKRGCAGGGENSRAVSAGAIVWRA